MLQGVVFAPTDVTNDNRSNASVGQIGYTFCKEFKAGWFTGEVMSIRIGAGTFYYHFIKEWGDGGL